jgi:hypothetical protein
MLYILREALEGPGVPLALKGKGYDFHPFNTTKKIKWVAFCHKYVLCTAAVHIRA